MFISKKHLEWLKHQERLAGLKIGFDTGKEFGEKNALIKLKQLSQIFKPKGVE